MQLDPYVETIHTQLDSAAEAVGEEARDLARRLVAPLDAAIRLALQDALTTAAQEITVELAPGSVELRLRGRDLEFVVTAPSEDRSLDDATDREDSALRAVTSRSDGDGDGGTISRINLRMPEQLKTRIEHAAEHEGLSVNAWLVRAAATRLEREGARLRERRAPRGAQGYTGWAR